MTEKDARKELMRRALELTPTVHVGKDGLKESVAEEIKAQIKKNRLIKIRILPAADTDSDTMAAAVAAATGTVVVDVRGGVVILTDDRTWKSLSQKKF